ncbi:alpha/beta fold hydrolase [Paraburkholderia caffeinilytica]|uniref:alpha/beta fold hydrolase n=1 Tax=Paraburkholderia caffeinilytica TaxID=1761016 RepID=UPI003DA185BC
MQRIQSGPSVSTADLATVRYKTVDVGGINIFYREAGSQDAPVLLLLHGYPSSSRMFEPLLPLLAKDYRLIAPDYPGFGLSEAPDRSVWPYTFDHLAQTVLDFSDALGLERYSMYLQDYGGPIGFRVALARPGRVQALIVQNAVLHEEGLTPVWNLRRAYWADRTQYEREVRESMYSVQSGVGRHVGGRPDPERFNPDLWMDELAFLRRPGMDAIQLDLVYDYQTNVTAYPRWQAYLRDHRPPALVVWGIHDPIFSIEGAKAVLQEQPDAEIRLLEAGHFAINDRPLEIAHYISTFLMRAVQ